MAAGSAASSEAVIIARLVGIDNLGLRFKNPFSKWDIKIPGTKTQGAAVTTLEIATWEIALNPAF